MCLNNRLCLFDSWDPYMPHSRSLFYNPEFMPHSRSLFYNPEFKQGFCEIQYNRQSLTSNSNCTTYMLLFCSIVFCCFAKKKSQKVLDGVFQRCQWGVRIQWILRDSLRDTRIRIPRRILSIYLSIACYTLCFCVGLLIYESRFVKDVVDTTLNMNLYIVYLW